MDGNKLKFDFSTKVLYIVTTKAIEDGFALFLLDGLPFDYYLNQSWLSSFGISPFRSADDCYAMTNPNNTQLFWYYASSGDNMQFNANSKQYSWFAFG